MDIRRTLFYCGSIVQRYKFASLFSKRKGKECSLQLSPWFYLPNPSKSFHGRVQEIQRTTYSDIPKDIFLSNLQKELSKDFLPQNTRKIAKMTRSAALGILGEDFGSSLKSHYGNNLLMEIYGRTIQVLGHSNSSFSRTPTENFLLYGILYCDLFKEMLNLFPP